MSRSKVNNYMMLLNQVDTEVLEFCKEYQKGRVADDATNVAIFDFNSQYIKLLDKVVTDILEFCRNIKRRG